MTRGRRRWLALRRRALPSPPPCRFIPALSQDRTPAVLPNHPELAGPAPDQPPDHRRPDRRHQHRHRAHRPAPNSTPAPTPPASDTQRSRSTPCPSSARTSTASGTTASHLHRPTRRHRPRLFLRGPSRSPPLAPTTGPRTWVLRRPPGPSEWAIAAPTRREEGVPAPAAPPRRHPDRRGGGPCTHAPPRSGRAVGLRQGCGGGLAGAPGTVASRIQVFDLPAFSLAVTEYLLMRRRCGCGHATTACGVPEVGLKP